MNRSEVESRVVLMPMKIKTQWEGDKLIAMMPAWQLPFDLLAKGNDMEDALKNLAERMLQHWG